MIYIEHDYSCYKILPVLSLSYNESILAASHKVSNEAMPHYGEQSEH